MSEPTAEQLASVRRTIIDATARALDDRHITVTGTVSAAPRWINIDGMLHFTVDCPSCAGSPDVCGACGGRVHRQPLHDGMAEVCEACDAGEWSDDIAAIPAHRDGMITIAPSR